MKTLFGGLAAMVGILGLLGGMAPGDEEKKPQGGTDVSPFFGTVVSSNVIFIIDTSNSMPNAGKVARIEADPPLPPDAKKKKKSKGVNMGDTGSRDELARKELIHIVEEILQPKTNFNIIAFNKTVTKWKEGIVPASDENKRAAVDFVKGLKLDGGTHSYDALREALKDDKADTIYFLSDGGPYKIGNGLLTWEENRKELDQIKKENARGVVIHAIALIVGNGKNETAESREGLEKMMRALAKENKGTFRVIDSEKR